MPTYIAAFEGLPYTSKNRMILNGADILWLDLDPVSDPDALPTGVQLSFDDPVIEAVLLQATIRATVFRMRIYRNGRLWMIFSGAIVESYGWQGGGAGQTPKQTFRIQGASVSEDFAGAVAAGP